MEGSVLRLTCDQTGDDKGENEHLQHPHQDVTREGDHHDNVRVDWRGHTQKHSKDGTQDHTYATEHIFMHAHTLVTALLTATTEDTLMPEQNTVEVVEMDVIYHMNIKTR